MSIDIVVRDKIQKSIDRKIKTIGRSADSTYAKIERLKQSLNIASTGNLGNVSVTINRISSSANRASSSLNRMNATSFGPLLNALHRSNIALQRFESNSIKSARALRTIVATGFLVGGAVAGLSKLDTFKETQNKLRPVANVETPDGQLDAIASQERLNELTRQLFDVAQEARVPVDDLAKSYRRFDGALSSLGKSQQQSLDITKTVAKALTLAGSNTNEASQTLLQLSQAFNKGKLDGDEFRTTAENIPDLINAISSALGISRAEIFDASKDGAISAQILVDAFEALKEKVDRDFASLPKTIGQSLTQMRNSIIQFFGALDQKTGISNSIISFIDGLSANLPTVINWVRAFGVALATLALPGLIAVLGLLGTLIASIGGVLAITTGYFAFFADEIKVSSDGVTTLSDVVGVLAGRIPELISAVTGIDIFQDIFSAEGAQKAYDNIISFATSIQDVIRKLIATAKGFGEAFGNALFEKDAQGFQKFAPENIFTEPFVAAFLTIKNAALDTFAAIAAVVDKPFIKLLEAIDLVLKKLGEVSAAMAKLSSVFSLAASKGFAEVAESLSKGIGFDPKKGTMEKAFLSLKSNVREATPTLHKFFDDWKASAIRNELEMSQSNKAFWDNVLRDASSAAFKRIELEEQVKQSMQPNPGALRGENPVASPVDNELARFNAAVETLRGKGGLVGAALRESSQFADEFRVKILESALATENFSRSTIEMGLGIQGANQSLQQAAPAADTMEDSASSAANAIQQIGPAISATQQVTAAFGVSGSQHLSTVGSAGEQSGSRIASAIQSAMASAMAAVSDFANNAISRLYAVADAASSINVGGGGGGLFGFAGGGYTGDLPTNKVAGVVHGQEFVVPAGPARQYRPLLEAMRNGQAMPTMPTPVIGSGGSNMNVTVENYGSSQISVERLSATDVRIIAREVALDAARNEAPRAVANQLRNPNSKVSKSFAQNTKTERRR